MVISLRSWKSPQCQDNYSKVVLVFRSFSTQKTFAFNSQPWVRKSKTRFCMLMLKVKLSLLRPYMRIAKTITPSFLPNQMYHTGIRFSYRAYRIKSLLHWARRLSASTWEDWTISMSTFNRYKCSYARIIEADFSPTKNRPMSFNSRAN